MSFSYLFDPNKQFQDRNGVNNVGGFLRVYIDGTDDRATTYKDFNGTLNEADIMLDTDGRAVVIVDDSFTFRIEVYERDGALQWTVTQFTARGEGGGGGSSTPVVVDGTANEIDVTESMTAGVKYYTIGLATVVKNTLLGLLASLSNLVGIFNSKADKVQGATAGNLAALDASGNLTDSGSKAADFKTKQTPVADPSASGAGLEFIDSVTQDANGEITPHKKSVQDGTTAQKGVVQLNNAINSTSTTEAATPKAVKDAYDALNNKIVARAVFLSQQEWAAQSQLQGDPAKVYYVENGTGEDAYTIYVWKESTSTYEEVDESSIDLDGYWHDGPTTTGSGNVVTNITLGNDGVPQVEKGMSAEPAFSVLPIEKGGTGKSTRKAATYNLFSDMGNIESDPDESSKIVFRYGTPNEASGMFFSRPIGRLWNYIQNKISSVLGLTASSYDGKAATAGAADTASAAASGSALETAINAKLDKTGDASNTTSTFTKASGDTSTMTSGSKLSAIFTAISSFFASLKALAFKDKVSDSDISGTISDSHIASASTWNGKQDSLGISASGDTGKFLNERGAFATPNYPSVPSVINNLTSDSTTDALSAAQGKVLNTNKADNYLKGFRIQNAGSGYAKIGRINVFKDSIWGDEMGCTFAIQCMYNSVLNSYRSVIGLMNIQFVAGSDGNVVAKMIVTQSQQTLSSITQSLEFIVSKVDNSKFDLFVRFLVSTGTKALNINLIDGYVGISYEDSLVLTNTAPSPAVNVPFVLMPFVESDGEGSTTTPVYVDANGQVKVCDPSQMGVGAASYAEKAKEGCKGSNTATLYIAGYTDSNIPYYAVKDIKNGCVNHVDFSGITNSTCNITFEAPTLSTGEEYDYIISLEGYTNNSGYSTGQYVENCKQVLRYDYVNNLWIGEPLFLQATDWRQICVVRGNTCEWKRVSLS